MDCRKVWPHCHCGREYFRWASIVFSWETRRPEREEIDNVATMVWMMLYCIEHNSPDLALRMHAARQLLEYAEIE